MYSLSGLTARAGTLVLVCVAAGCTTPLPKNSLDPPYPYHAEGCSLAPDLDVGDCCRAHDELYWKGGSCEERRVADHALRSCILAKGHPVLAPFYYAAVRLGGMPAFPFPWRWGFGWPYGMGYTEDCD